MIPGQPGWLLTRYRDQKRILGLRQRTSRSISASRRVRSRAGVLSVGILSQMGTGAVNQGSGN